MAQPTEQAPSQSERSDTTGAKQGNPSDDRTPWRVEGARESKAGRPAPPQRPSFWAALAVLLVIDWVLVLAFQPSTVVRVTVPYTSFTHQVQAGNVATVTAQGAAIQGTFRHAVTFPAQNGTTSNSPSGTSQKATTTTEFATNRPTFANDNLLTELQKEGATVTAKPTQSSSDPLLTFLGGVLPTLLLIGIWVYVIRRYWGQMSEGGGGMFGMGKSKAHKYESSAQRSTFADVAGIDEAKDELSEVVDFLKQPDRYTRLGAEIPRGVLLTGQPGTGKTLLARAVAGEADVPFFSISASEFVEMIVGVGASRVRDLFEQAKADAPSIIFIDELDAIGRSRSSGNSSGSNDEREQTLNQILTEMDGFTGNEGVIVLAATNRPEVLDSALLRPGRFDRRIAVQAPDQEGRLRILQVHTRSVPLKDPSDLEAMAASTPGMVGADLKNLVNEAALTAARRGEDSVSLEDFSNALERVTIGAARRIVISQEERRRTAYHESGHALLGMLQPGADPVRKISIIPRGQALGVTYQSPDADRYGYGESYLKGRLIGVLGGRAAEILIYGESTTGPENDLEQATSIARQMVGRWGMSEQVGAVS
ncbi:MAG TPA: ATP-dependent zinc metalloprotease FtsH, partial [Solirubrobacteraceae bacterium]|nr:ATP-dependent zinc metalloprotease FtsH [Solirubrobacteraceae bacterium]